MTPGHPRAHAHRYGTPVRVTHEPIAGPRRMKRSAGLFTGTGPVKRSGIADPMSRPALG